MVVLENLPYFPRTPPKITSMKYIIFTILYSCIIGNIQGQNCDYFIRYDFKYITDTVNQSISTPEKYVLYKVDDDTRFLSDAHYYNDSIMVIFRAKHPDPTISGELTQEKLERYAVLLEEHAQSNRRRQKSDYFINRNHQSKMCVNFVYNSYPKNFMKEQLQLDWTITNEKKTIKAIHCQKAITQYGGRTYIAWFAPSIPISDGPYVFNGLPGLILQISDNRGWYTFEVTDINLDKSVRYWKSNLFHRSYVKISRQKYLQKMEKELNNPSVPAGILGDDTEEIKLQLIERRKGRFDLLLEQM